MRRPCKMHHPLYWHWVASRNSGLPSSRRICGSSQGHRARGTMATAMAPTVPQPPTRDCRPDRRRAPVRPTLSSQLRILSVARASEGRSVGSSDNLGVETARISAIRQAGRASYVDEILRIWPLMGASVPVHLRSSPWYETAPVKRNGEESSDLHPNL